MAIDDNAPLSMLVKASVDESATSSTIQKQINKIASNIKLNISMDGTTIQKLEKQIAELRKQLTNQNGSVNIDTSKATKGIQTVTAKIEELKNQLKSGESIKITKLFDGDKASGELKKVTATITDLQGKVRKLNFVPDKAGTLQQISESVVNNTNKIQQKFTELGLSVSRNLSKLLNEGKLTEKQFTDLALRLNHLQSPQISINKSDYNEINKTAQLYAQEAQAEKRSQQQILNAVQQTVNKRRQAEQQLAEAQAKRINKSLEDNYKEAQAEKKSAQQLEQSVSEWQRLKSVQMDTMSNRFNDFKRVPDLAPEATKLRQQIAEIGRSINSVPADQLKKKMRDIDLSMKELGSQAEVSGGRIETFGESITRSIRSMIAWSVGGGLYFGVISGMKDMVNTIVDVDTKMTELKRVMNSNTDFNDMLQKSIALSQQLGRSLDDILDSESAFAQMGYSESQVMSLTKVSGLMQNISDLNATDATNALISGMTNFNVSAKDSIKIVNSLNNVDNHFAVTTQTLAQAMNKAGATAKTYHVSLNQLNGMVAAISQSTRESGSQIGNALKSIFSEFSSEKAITALRSIGVEVTKSNGQMKSAWQILKETAERYSSLSDEQKNFVSLSVAGRYRLTQWNALMANFSTAEKAAATSAHSAGSAMQEQERYSNSYQARINRLTNAWKEFQLTMGKSFVNSGLSDGIAALLNLTKVMTQVISKFGALPTATTIAIAGLVLFNKHVRTMISLLFSMKKWGDVFNVIGASTVGLSKKMEGLGGAIGVVKASWRGLLASTVIGVLFVGASVAVEKLIGAYQKYRAEQAKVNKEVSTGTNSYRNHNAEIKTLVARYKELSSQSAKGTLSSKDNKEYISVQNKLNKLIPTLTDHIDKNGNAHLRNASAIDKEINQYKKLASAQNTKFIDDFDSKMNKANKDIDKATAKLKELQANSSFNSSKVGGINTPTAWKAAGPATSSDKNNIRSISEQIVAEKDLQNALSKRKTLMKQFASVYATQIGAQNHLTSSDQKYINSLVDQNSKELKTKKGQQSLEGQIKQTTATFDELRSVLGKGVPTNDLVDLSKDLNNLKASKGIGTLLSDIKKFAEGKMSAKELREAIEKMGNSAETSKGFVSELSDAQEDGAKSTKKHTKAVYDLVDALGDAEQFEDKLTAALLGNKDDLDTLGLKQATNAYMILSAAADQAGGKTKLNAQQQQYLSQMYQKLAAEFPQYVNGHNLNIKAIQKEINAEDVLKDALDKAANGQLTSEQAATVAKMTGTKQRIDNINKEILALEKAIKAIGYYQQAYEETVQSLEENADSGDPQDQAQQAKVARYQQSQSDKGTASLKKLQKELSKERKSLQGTTDDFDSLSKSLKKSIDNTDAETGEMKDSTVEVTRYRYAHNYLAEALDKVNSKIQIATDLTERYDKASSKYRSSVSAEISLLKEKGALLKAQANSLAQQIKSGNIAQYGVLSSSSTTGGGTSSKGSSTGAGVNVNLVTGGANYTAAELNSWINKHAPSGSAMRNQGAAFLKAANTTGLNPVYLIAHAALETGWGTSSMAKAGNFFGIGAFDSNPSNGYNYTNGIVGGAEWILKHFTEGKNANTLAKMKAAGYATDPGWANKIASIMAGSGMGIGGSYSGSGSGSVSIGEEAANAASAKVQAQSDLNGLKEQIIANENAIQQAYMDLVNSHIQVYENRIKSLDNSIAKYQMKAEESDPASKTYRNDLNKEISLSKQKQKQQQNEINYINKQIKSNHNLNSAAKADLKSEVLDKQAELRETQQAIKELYQEVTTSQIAYYENISKAIDVTISKYEELAQSAEENSKAELDALNSEESATKKKLTNQQKELDYINKQIKSNKNLTGAFKADLKSQAQDLQSNIYSTQSSIADLAKQIKAIYLDLSDNVTQVYKDMYQEQIDAAQKAHDKKVDLINDESDKYQKAIQKEIDAIDKQNDEDTYKSDLADKMKAVTDLQTKIGNYSLDTSEAGKRTVADLQQQLQDAQKELADFQKDHNIETQKDALQSQSDAYQENAEAQTKSLDEQMQNYEDAVNNIINDDRKWTQIQKDILDKHYGAILSDFDNFSKQFKSESDLIGTSISNNMIDKIAELEKKLKDFGISSGGKNTSSGNTSIPTFDEGGSVGNWNGGLPRLVGVHSGEFVLNDQQQKNIINTLANEGRLATSTLLSSISTPSLIPQVKNVTNNSNGGSVDIHIDNITLPAGSTEDSAKKIFGILGNGLRKRGFNL